MKNRTFYIFILLILSAKMNAQVFDTVFEYDKVIVYDTIKVYDTVKVEDKILKKLQGFENNFENNFNAESAVLAIDTASKKAELVLFNKNDTATISINSIILSEPNKNLEKMKKEILLLAAAAMLNQSGFAQEGKTTTATSEETLPGFTIGVGAVLAATMDGYVQGIHLKANKFVNSKLGFGISSDIGRMHEKGFSGGSEVGNSVIGNTSGLYANFFATASYYLLGKTTSKAGMYTKLGIGVLGYRTEQTQSAVGYSNVSKSKLSASSFSSQLCLGVDFKLGNGRVFTEIDALPSFVGQRSLVILNSDPPDPAYKTVFPDWNFKKPLQSSFRIGYVINF